MEVKIQMTLVNTNFKWTIKLLFIEIKIKEFNLHLSTNLTYYIL